MTIMKQEAKRHMRRSIYDAIRHNQIFRSMHLSRYEIVEILVGIMAEQLEIIKTDAEERRID